MRAFRGLTGLVVMAALVLQACSGSGTRPARVVDVTKVHYGPALVSAEDLQFIGDFLVAGQGSTAGRHLPTLCGRRGSPTPRAVAGGFRELQQPGAGVSVTASVYGFASDEAAKQAFASSRGVANTCHRSSTFTSDGATFVRTANPTVQNGGDESFSLFARRTDTGLVVADVFVRGGRYVLALRFAVPPGAAVDAGVVATAATEASREFASWADDH